MSLLEQLQSGRICDTGSDERQRQGRQTGPEQQTEEQQGQQNVGDNERAVSVAAGSIVALLGLRRGTLPGLLVGGVGAALIYRGVTGRCPMYQSMGIDTAQPQQRPEDEISERGVHIAQAFLINRSPEELYRFWRNFENLPRIMTHLESVRVIDERRSHWVAKAPRIVGGKVEWDAEIIRDDPSLLIEWRSLPGSDIDTTGQVRFTPGLGDRGTEVHAYMDYVPPAGKLGHFIAAMLGENPKRVVREDLRNFKRIMEVGEILTIIGQPHGTCTGQGKRYTESEWKPLFA